MLDYQRAFFDFAAAQGALRFGEFTLKSGRVSPYFFNAGDFSGGAALARLGRYYAAAVAGSGLSFDLLFGPAYKGIPLVSSLAVALAEHHDRDLPWCFNRKEIKDHGEGGALVGAALKPGQRVLLVDDVITKGTAIGEVLPLLEARGASLAGVVIALDRQERGADKTSAVQDVERCYRAPVLSVATLADLIEYLSKDPTRAAQLDAVRAYRDRYGV